MRLVSSYKGNTMHIARKTYLAINQALEKDQGAMYRYWLGKVLPHIGDAYSTKNERHRPHLGASIIGQECARNVWYSFNWATASKHEGRLLRLFNRGHLEEGRFIALLLMIGCQVYQQDANGKQFRISDVDGYFGGSGDGIAVGIPDLAPGTPCVCEFKTHNSKSFAKLTTEGVQQAKPEHFIQTQIYMRKMGLPATLYVATNKDNDELHCEIILLNSELADEYLERARRVVWLSEPPEKLSNSAGYFKCKFCSHYNVCQRNAAPDRNCRTCAYSEKCGQGEWRCLRSMLKLTTQQQLDACDAYTVREVYK